MNNRIEKPVAVIVDPYSSGNQFAPSFKKAGVPVLAVLSGGAPPDVYSKSYRPEDFDHIIKETGNINYIVDQLKKYNPLCVIPGCESGVELADAISPQVVPSVSNDPDKAQARRHKGLMAAAVSEAGIPTISQIYTDDINRAKAWIHRNGLHTADIVIKPPKSASTDGVTLVRRGEKWDKIFNEMLGKRNRLGLVNDSLVIQEYVNGVEYVVDSFSYEGIHTINGICKYHKIDNGSFFAVYDHMQWLPMSAPACSEIVDYARKVLSAVGMRFGAAHIEIMLTADGPKLIEIGARPHGGGHPEFSRIATGESQIDRTVDYFTGHRKIPIDFSLCKQVMVIFLVCRKNAVVRNIDKLLDGLKTLASCYKSYINIENGDKVEQTKDLFSTLELGYVVLAHSELYQIKKDYGLFREMERTVFRV